MKAAILNAYQPPLSIEEVEIDPPKADEVLVKIAAAGVCHSDYHIMKGEWQSGVPMILGHEASGIVAEVGPGVTGLKPGDRCALSFRAWCGRCRYCIAGRPILCNGYDGGPRGSMLDGTYRVHRNGEDIPVMGRMGGFAEYAVMPAQQVVPITADIDMDVAGADRLRRDDRRRRRPEHREGRVRQHGRRDRVGRRRAERGAGGGGRRREPDLRHRPAGQQAGLRRLVRRHAIW